jgi:hypothetical protein
MKSKLKPRATKRLKLKSDKSLSILLQFCFQIQLAPVCHGAVGGADAAGGPAPDAGGGQGLTLVHICAQSEPYLSLQPAKHPNTWDTMCSR